MYKLFGFVSQSLENDLNQRFFLYEWFESVEELAHYLLPACDEIFSSLCHCNPLDKTFSDYQNLMNAECNTEEDPQNLKLSKLPPTSKENYL